MIKGLTIKQLLFYSIFFTLSLNLMASNRQPEFQDPTLSLSSQWKKSNLVNLSQSVLKMHNILTKNSVVVNGKRMSVFKVSSAEELSNTINAHYNGETPQDDDATIVVINRDIVNVVKINRIGQANRSIDKPLIITSACKANRNSLNCPNANSKLLHNKFRLNRMDLIAVENIAFVQIPSLNNFNQKKENLFSWKIYDSQNVYMYQNSLSGTTDNILEAVANPRVLQNLAFAIMLKNSKSLFFESNRFNNLFYGIQFGGIEKLFALKNYFNRIVSDPFHGGALSMALFDSNRFETKLPFKANVDGKNVEVHSDFIQLHTNNGYLPSKNVTFKNNVSTRGEYDYIKNKRFIFGWQCYFIKLENKSFTRGTVLNSVIKQYYKSGQLHSNIRVYGNSCETNQHHGVTFQGVGDGVIFGNSITAFVGSDLIEPPEAQIRVTHSYNISVEENTAEGLYWGERSEIDDCHPFGITNGAINVTKNTVDYRHYYDLAKNGIDYSSCPNLSENHQD